MWCTTSKRHILIANNVYPDQKSHWKIGIWSGRQDLQQNIRNVHKYVRMSNISDPDQTRVNLYAGLGLHRLQVLQTLLFRAASHIVKVLLNEYRTNRMITSEILHSQSTSLGYKLFAKIFRVNKQIALSCKYPWCHNMMNELMNGFI